MGALKIQIGVFARPLRSLEEQTLDVLGYAVKQELVPAHYVEVPENCAQEALQELKLYFPDAILIEKPKS